MLYLVISSSISDIESICFGPVFTAARSKHLFGYLAEVEQEFNREKGLVGVSRVRLTIDPAKEASAPLFPEGDLHRLRAAVLDMLRRQYRERYDEIQNV
jgi:hypothetical protein